jgi:chemotaxis protein histidine kinase CheA
MSKSEMSVSSMSIVVSEQLTRQLVNTAQDLAIRCVRECASKYNFDAEEAIRSLGLEMIKLERKAPLKEKPEKGPKEAAPKAAFPLPYNGSVNDACCYALRQNNGLYTQCPLFRKKDGQFCKSCTRQMEKAGADVPEYGTIEMRQAVGIMEYVDPKGRKPVHYTKVMKKFKITEEKAREEADKLNIQLNEIHFEITDLDSKRGRPAKEAKVPKEKGVKGRPKKSQKVLQILGDDDDGDLFAELVAQANEETEEEQVKPKKAGKSEEEKEAERQAKEQEKAAKEAKRLQEKAEKEAAKEAERQAKEQEKAKKEAERKAKEAEKEAEKAKKEAERKAKEEEKAKKEAEKAEKEAKKKEKEEKPSKGKSSKKEEPKEDDEPDVVKKIEFEGKKYLKSKKSGIIYDYTEYVKNQEQVIVGKWNESTNKIDFEEEDKDSDEEESEEEYDM